MDLPLIDLPSRQTPFVMPWPVEGHPAGLVQFHHVDQWHAFVVKLDLDVRIPEVVRRKYARAQKLYWLGWIDADLIKAGELMALTTLELALKDRYGDKVKARTPTFAALLKHLVEVDGLTDAQIPMVSRCGGSAIGQLVGTDRPTLAERRNAMAHGDPFDGLPVAGLLELVRDLITFAYRHFIAQSPSGVPVHE